MSCLNLFFIFYINILHQITLNNEILMKRRKFIRYGHTGIKF